MKEKVEKWLERNLDIFKDILIYDLEDMVKEKFPHFVLVKKYRYDDLIKIRNLVDDFVSEIEEI